MWPKLIFYFGFSSFNKMISIEPLQTKISRFGRFSHSCRPVSFFQVCMFVLKLAICQGLSNKKNGTQKLQISVEILRSKVEGLHFTSFCHEFTKGCPLWKLLKSTMFCKVDFSFKNENFFMRIFLLHGLKDLFEEKIF